MVVPGIHQRRLGPPSPPRHNRPDHPRHKAGRWWCECGDRRRCRRDGDADHGGRAVGDAWCVREELRQGTVRLANGKPVRCQCAFFFFETGEAFRLRLLRFQFSNKCRHGFHAACCMLHAAGAWSPPSSSTTARAGCSGNRTLYPVRPPRVAPHCTRCTHCPAPPHTAPPAHRPVQRHPSLPLIPGGRRLPHALCVCAISLCTGAPRCGTFSAGAARLQAHGAAGLMAGPRGVVFRCSRGYPAVWQTGTTSWRPRGQRHSSLSESTRRGRRALRTRERYAHSRAAAAATFPRAASVPCCGWCGLADLLAPLLAQEHRGVRARLCSLVLRCSGKL